MTSRVATGSQLGSIAGGDEVDAQRRCGKPPRRRLYMAQAWRALLAQNYHEGIQRLERINDESGQY